MDGVAHALEAVGEVYEHVVRVADRAVGVSSLHPEAPQRVGGATRAGLDGAQALGEGVERPGDDVGAHARGVAREG